MTTPAPHGVFVYGFGPYDRFRHNITETIVRRLQRAPGLTTAVFPVHFRRAMFLAPVRRARPKVIIGLGQRRGGRKLRLERQAVNRRGGRGERLRPVTPFGRSRLPVTLRLPRTAGTRLSTDAGTYVCNFSMYVFLEHCRATGARFAFIHVPRRHNVRAATAYVSRVVRTLLGGTARTR